MECELKDITVHYELFGEGRPILMLHGWGVDHRHMVSNMEPIFSQRSGWKRLYLDLPGHGQTPGMDWITNQDKMLEVVLDFINTIIPGEKYALAGASAGAYLARGVVHHQPAGTLLADPALASGLNTEEADYFQLAVVQSQKSLDFIRANFTSAIDAGDPLFQSSIRDHPENYAFSFDVDALPAPFPAPTLILTGRQDAVVGYRDAWEILENYPRGTFAVLDRAGHFASVEQDALFRALVGEWLDRVDEYDPERNDGINV